MHVPAPGSCPILGASPRGPLPCAASVSERRPSNFELRLRRLEEEKPDGEERGILELFPEEGADEASDEDAPLARDDGRE